MAGMQEGDAAVAYTAHSRGWLVLSNDSDFCIFDVPGFIGLNSLRLSAHELACSCTYRRASRLCM